MRKATCQSSSTTDNASLSSALSGVDPGRTIHLNAGTYNPFTISRSGNSSAWIVIKGEAGSPASNAGVVLNNFNSLDSAWPHSGSAPDIGAYEGDSVQPTAPQNLRVVP